MTKARPTETVTELWYVVTWRGSSGRRFSYSPTRSLEWARDLRSALCDPPWSAVRKFTTREEAERFHFRTECSR